MKVTNNSGAPRKRINWIQVFLVALHMVTLIVSLAAHDMWTVEAASRALP